MENKKDPERDDRNGVRKKKKKKNSRGISVREHAEERSRIAYSPGEYGSIFPPAMFLFLFATCSGFCSDFEFYK